MSPTSRSSLTASSSSTMTLHENDVLPPPVTQPPTASKARVPKPEPLPRHATSEKHSSSTDGPNLARTTSNRSIHAQNSLRRMATHETGEGVSQQLDGARGLDTHDEHEHEHDHDHDPDQVQDEEKNIEGGVVSQERKPKDNVELQDQTNLLPTKQVIMIFFGLTLAFFCSLLDQTIVTTALPTLGRVFNRADISSWVGTSYLLTSTALQPIYGRLSDIFGRKVVLLGALTIFLIGSLACALSTSMIMLIVFRGVQGIGGGGILTLGMIIISDVVSLKERGKYQGISGGIIACANSLGPIIGGLFTERASWRWCFYINLPLTSLAIFLIVILLPLRRVKGSIVSKLGKVDWLGSFLTLAWVILVLLALSWGGGSHPWASAAVLAPLIIGIGLLGAFLMVEWKVAKLPLIPFHIFRNVTFTVCIITTLFNGMMFYATLYYLPQFFQVVHHASAIRSGVLLLPLVLVQTTTAFTSGMLQSKTGDYLWNLTVGYAMWTVGVGLLSTIDENTSIAKLVGFQIIDGIGAGQTFQTSLVAIQAAVPRREMATATGIRNFTRMMGGTLALTICSAIITNVVRNHLQTAGLSDGVMNSVLADPTTLTQIGLSASQQATVISAYAKGIQACFYYMIPCGFLSCIMTVIFVKPIPLKRDDDQEKKAEAKAWLESKKEKHKHHKGEKEAASRKPSDTSALETSNHQGMEGVLEDVGRGMEESAGMQPSASEGIDQGPIGTGGGR